MSSVVCPSRWDLSWFCLFFFVFATADETLDGLWLEVSLFVYSVASLSCSSVFISSLSRQVYQRRYPIDSLSTFCNEDVTEFETILFSFSSDRDLRKERNRCATMHCRRQKYRWSAKSAVYPPTSLLDSLDMDRWWLIGDACSWVAVVFIGRFPEVVRTWVLTHII